MPLNFAKWAIVHALSLMGPISIISRPKTLVGFIGNQSLSKFFIILISPTAEPSKILFCYHPHGLHHHRQRHARRDSRGLRHHRHAPHRNSVLQPSNTGNSPSFGVAYITQEQPSPVPYSRLHHQLWRASHGASTRGGLPSPEKCYRSDCFRGQRTLTMASAPAPTRLLP